MFADRRRVFRNMQYSSTSASSAAPPRSECEQQCRDDHDDEGLIACPLHDPPCRTVPKSQERAREYEQRTRRARIVVVAIARYADKQIGSPKLWRQNQCSIEGSKRVLNPALLQSG